MALGHDAAAAPGQGPVTGDRDAILQDADLAGRDLDLDDALSGFPSGE
jgi:hypothetical protein